MVIPGWSSTCAPAIKLRNLAMKLLPASFLDSCVNQKESIPPLQFPPVDNLLPALLQVGLSAECASTLYQEFTNTVRQVNESLLETYCTSAPQFCQNPQVPQLSKSSFIEALQVHLLGVRAQTIHKIWLALLSRAEALVQQSRSISTTSQATSPLSSSASSTKPRGRAPNLLRSKRPR
ncbi:hypothetical protein H4Q26_008987 [Puccinia striiformis f. sp. tritici PST-130]|nr:hypothetical protein H4Q26_008987 [Puccinia striiformis f. sp. tritici PST-130]